MVSSNLLIKSPKEFVEYLRSEGIQKFYVVYDKEKKRLNASHPQLQEIADYFSEDKRDFDTHEGFFIQVSNHMDSLLGSFVHRTNRGQAAGGVRYWKYNTIEDYFRDGLRLGKGMTLKNAMAGLWWGGGKGVITEDPEVDRKENRDLLYREYGKFMTSLNGCYITAEDVGTSVEDMANIFSNTRYTTCIPQKFGGSGNPSAPTAKGVVCGMEAALNFMDASTLENKTIAVQGMGHVAEPMFDYLFEKKVKKIIACDIYPDLVEKLKTKYSDKNFEAYVVERDDISIFSTEADIFSPCATGAILNRHTIPNIKAKIVCGAANNQLEDADRDDAALFEKNIIYIPDFLTNRMGIVNCANEQYGFINDDPIINLHFGRDWEYSIFNMAMNTLKESEKSNTPTNKIAQKIADNLSKIDHPIFGHRGEKIIEDLVKSSWEQ